MALCDQTQEYEVVHELSQRLDKLMIGLDNAVNPDELKEELTSLKDRYDAALKMPLSPDTLTAIKSSFIHLRIKRNSRPTRDWHRYLYNARIDLEYHKDHA